MFLSLIGYRGSGKSAVAQLVALRLGWDWVDADVEIELRAGKSIAAIFSDDGEEQFRALESDVLQELIKRDRAVLALGGGVVLREENRRQMLAASQQESGAFVWLEASPETLWERIRADVSTAARRPNLTASGGLDEIRKLLPTREPFYRECAKAIVDTDGKSLAEVADEIVRWMRPPNVSPPAPRGYPAEG